MPGGLASVKCPQNWLPVVFRSEAPVNILHRYDCHKNTKWEVWFSGLTNHLSSVVKKRPIYSQQWLRAQLASRASLSIQSSISLAFRRTSVQRTVLATITPLLYGCRVRETQLWEFPNNRYLLVSSKSMTTERRKSLWRNLRTLIIQFAITSVARRTSSTLATGIHARTSHQHTPVDISNTSSYTLCYKRWTNHL